MPSQKDFASANARAKRLRREMTHAEKKLWKMLRQLPEAHFRRQVPIGPYVFDFASHHCKLIIEVDGGIHRLPDVQSRDAVKTRFAAREGYTLLCFSNEDVIGGPDSVFAKVEEAANGPFSSFYPENTGEISRPSNVVGQNRSHKTLKEKHHGS